MTFGILALTVAALFTGAAPYVSFVEHPARARLDDRAQLEQWKPAYARGAVMQARWQPTNRTLQRSRRNASMTSRALMNRRGGLHAVRTALGIAATAIFVWLSTPLPGLNEPIRVR